MNILRSLFGKQNEPSASAQPVRQGQQSPTAVRDAGSYRGTFSDWHVLRRFQGAYTNERTTLAHRVDDLFANDGTAHSAINAFGTNVVGTGLKPQLVLPWKRLGITREQAKGYQDQIEWLWFEWCSQAHYRGQLSFEQMQDMAVRSLIRYGEFLHLPIMEKRPRSGCKLRLRIQDVSPLRLRTPADLGSNPLMHDGVETTETGIPVAYWIASPVPRMGVFSEFSLSSVDFVRIPARLPFGRLGVFHVFNPEDEEQYRGISALAPVVSFLRSFSDSIDNELLGQVMASSMPIFISLSEGTQNMPAFVERNDYGNQRERSYYQEVHAGQILYGAEGEKPEVLESKRPSANFLNFCELVLRSIGASLGLPYEVLTKDFSKTNYSSARAAMLEAWRVYDVYRQNFVRQYCQPVFDMVVEEGFLSGILKLPCTVAEFYANKSLWTNARWTGPARGYVDPMKEVQAQIAAIDAGLLSRSDAIAERGGDFEDVVSKLAEEKQLRKELGLEESTASMDGKQTTDDLSKEEERAQGNENGNNDRKA